MWRWILPLVLAGEAFAQSEKCLECHGDKVTPEAYRASVHGSVACTECHRRPAGSFDETPHKKAEPDLTRCTACHGLNLKEFKVELKGGVHGNLDCGECHDAHTMRRDRETAESGARAAAVNAACLRCHADADLRGAAKGHLWLPNRERHARMRCLVCHAALDAEHDHEILPRARATRSCDACHAADSALIEKYAAGERRSWVTNPVLFEKAYVPGATRNRLADAIVLALFALTVVGSVSHGLARAVAGAVRKAVPFEVHSSRLYPVGLRLWHWANAALVILLAATGFRLHFGGREAPLLTFETAFNIHNVAGAILVVVGIAFFVRNAVVGDTRQYVGKPEDGARGLLRQVGFYLVGIFRGADHPYHARPERRFNPLQQVTYGGIMYVVFPILVASGVVLLFPHWLPEKLGGRPAVWWFATAHYLSAVAMVAFLLGHIYLATTGDRVRYHFVAMITGLHRRHVRRDHT